MTIVLDRTLPVPLRAQLRGLIQYGIACGDLAPGARLPSVRDMAEEVGVAPMTVAQVYRELKQDGLLETRAGSGTFVARGPARPARRHDRLAEFHRRINDLVDEGLGLGLPASEIAGLVGARLSGAPRRNRKTVLVMVGIFAGATETYARRIAEGLGRAVTVEPMTIGDLRRNESMRERAAMADLVLTFAHQRREVETLLPSRTVIAISFIPSEATRRALASLDPQARVLVVSRLPEFLHFMKTSVQRFAPHVPAVMASLLDAPGLDALMAQSGVVVLSTGSETVLSRLPAGVSAFEYSHVPDPGDIERVVRPLLRTGVSDRWPDATARLSRAGAPLASVPDRKAS